MLHYQVQYLTSNTNTCRLLIRANYVPGLFHLPRATCCLTLWENKPVQGWTWEFNQGETTKPQNRHIHRVKFRHRWVDIEGIDQFFIIWTFKIQMSGGEQSIPGLIVALWARVIQNTAVIIFELFLIFSSSFFPQSPFAESSYPATMGCRAHWSRSGAGFRERAEGACSDSDKVTPQQISS